MTSPSSRPPRGRRRCSTRSSTWLYPEVGEGPGKGSRTPEAGAPAGGRAWRRGTCLGCSSLPASKSELDCPLVAGGCQLKAAPTPDALARAHDLCLPPDQLSVASSILCPAHQKDVYTTTPWVPDSQLATALSGLKVTILQSLQAPATSRPMTLTPIPYPSHSSPLPSFL